MARRRVSKTRHYCGHVGYGHPCHRCAQASRAEQERLWVNQRRLEGDEARAEAARLRGVFVSARGAA